MSDGQEFPLEFAFSVLRHTIGQDIHTSLPGKIVAYYPDKQTADVQPMVKRTYWSDTEVNGVAPGNVVYESFPLIPNVPVEFPGAGGYVLLFPVSAGDTCDILFSGASIADYLSSGQESAPTDVGRHKLAYAVCHPIYNPTTPIAPGSAGNNDRLVLGTPGGVQIQINGSNVILGDGATDFVALASKVAANFTLLTTALTAMATAASVGPAAAAPVLGSTLTTLITNLVTALAFMSNASTLVKSK